MVSERKRYLIKIFIKKCTMQNINQRYLDFYFRWCENTYNVPPEKIKKIKEKITLDLYIEKLIPVIDKYFSIDELKEIIKFYSSGAGKNLINTQFMEDVEKIGKSIGSQLEQEFALNNQ